MKAIKEMFKKLLIPGYTDRKVRDIHRDIFQKIEASSEASRRYNALLKKNGVTMQIVIAAGGEHHGSH